MKLQLRQRVAGVGDAGAIVDVSDAHARNFLLPKRLAIPATAAVIATQQHAKEKEQHLRREHQAEVTAAALRLQNVTVRMTARANDRGTLFAALKTDTIRGELERQYHLHLPEFACTPDHIKTIGTHEIHARLGSGANCTFNVVVEHGSS